jgi:hypothetical protein
VYYVEDHEIGGLWRISTNGGEPQPIYTDHPVKFYAIQDDQLYCLIEGESNAEIYHMNLDGSNQSKINSPTEKLHAINICGNRLLIVESPMMANIL